MKRCNMNFFGIFALFLSMLFINNCSAGKVSEPKQKPDAGKDVKTDTGQDAISPDVPTGDAPPFIQLNFQDGDVITGESTEIIASATDDKGISKVEFFIDEEKVATKTEVPYSYVWDVSQIFDGTYYLKAIAYDTIDQTAKAEVRVIVRIPDRPEVVIINPTKNADVCGLITIEAAVTVTPNRTIAVVEFFIDDKFLANDKSGPTYTADWDTRNFSNEEHEIKAIIIDSANAKAKDEIVAIVDNTAGRCDNLPSIVIEEPKTDTFINALDDDNFLFKIKARASDDFGVVLVRFFINNGMIGEDPSTPYSINWNIDDFEEGPHTIKAVAYDTANQFAAMTIQVTLDRTAPSVKILSPSDNQHFGGEDGEIIPIKVEASDNFGVKEVRLLVVNLDGEKILDILNAPPYEYDWDITELKNDQYYIRNEIRVIAIDSAEIENSDKVTIYLDLPPKAKWEFSAGKGLGAAPAIGSDGTVYAYFRDGKLYALNPDGTEKWDLRMYDSEGFLAIDNNNTIYFLSDQQSPKHLHAVNPNGTVKWTIDHYGFCDHCCCFTTPPAIGNDGTIYFGYGKQFYAFSSDGTEKWAVNMGGEQAYCAAAIGPDNTIYVGSRDAKKLFAINPHGTKKWEFDTKREPSSPAIGADGIIYVNSWNLYAINPNGTEKWAVKTDGTDYIAPAIANDGTIYAGSSYSALYAINPDGTTKWRFSAGDRVYDPAVGNDGTIYVACGKKLCAIHSNGSKMWEFTLGGESFSPAIDNSGTIYIGFPSSLPGSDSKLYAIESPSYGLSKSSWPKYRHDNRNTGNVNTPIE